MKTQKIWKGIYTGLFLLMLVAEVLAVRAVVRLNMLPVNYLKIMAGILTLLGVAVGLLLFWKGRGKARRVVAAVLAVLMLFACAAVTTVATDVRKTLSLTSRTEDGAAIRVVYVRKDDPSLSLADTGDFTYGYVKNYDESCTEQVLETVREQTGSPVATAGYLNAFQMTDALLEGRIDAVVLSGGYLSILEDTAGYEDLHSRLRVLTFLQVQEPEYVQPEPEASQPQQLTAPPAETQPQETEPAEVDYADLKPFAVYVSGSDSYDSEIVMNGRSDVNILAVVNPVTKQILLVNTPRDYYVKNTSGGGKEDKLTHCGIYGTSCSMKTLGNLYETQIDYFVRVNFSGFKKLIDAMGGITVYSDYAFTAITRTPIAQGENHLTGQQALDFARERYTLQGGDNERGKHQMQVITAVIEKATSGTTILSGYSEIMASVEGMFSMNIPLELISNLMKLQLTDMAKWNIVSYSVTGTDAMKECYSVPGMELSVIEPSAASVSRAIRLINMVRDGSRLTEEVMLGIG